jgi:AcrR family transcriptional regulator
MADHKRTGSRQARPATTASPGRRARTTAPSRHPVDPPAAAEPTTAERVENAVLEILEEQGVLAGINLNEVAAKAGVNRGLVYHHFGNRRGLLRSAIKRRMLERKVEKQTPKSPMPLGERVLHALHATLKSRDTLRLTTLLHLDGSTAPKLMPNAETTLLLLERDRALGLIPEGTDLPALHAVYAAAIYGYVVYREVFARDLGVTVEELDTRVADTLLAVFGQGPRPE